MCFFFSAFVFVFLRFFKPFGIFNAPIDINTLAIGYAVVCFVSMVILNIAIVPLLPKFFHETKWTTGREILWILINVMIVGMANILYSVYLGFIGFTWEGFLTFQGYTIAIGVFPIVISILIDENIKNRRFKKGSDDINVRLAEPARKTEDKDLLHLPSENGNEDLELPSKELLFIRSSDNYVEVHHLQNGQPAKKLMRSSLKLIADQLGSGTHLFRCHRSYMVNLSKVVRVSGNAQGYKLHFAEVEGQIPVSRNFNTTIGSLLSAHH